MLGEGYIMQSNTMQNELSEEDQKMKDKLEAMSYLDDRKALQEKGAQNLGDLSTTHDVKLSAADKEMKEKLELMDSSNQLQEELIQSQMNPEEDDEDLADRVKSWIWNNPVTKSQVALSEAALSMTVAMSQLLPSLARGAYASVQESVRQSGGDPADFIIPTDEEASASWDVAKEAFEYGMQNVSYQPKSAGGQMIVSGVAEVGTFIEKITSGLMHDATLFLTDNESAADAAYMTTEALLIWLPTSKTGSAQIAKAGKKVTKPVVGPVKWVGHKIHGGGQFLGDLFRPQRKGNLDSLDDATTDFANQVADQGVGVERKLQEAKTMEEEYGIKLSLAESTGDEAAVAMEHSLAGGSGASQRAQTVNKLEKYDKLQERADVDYGVGATEKAALTEKLQRAQTMDEGQLARDINKTEVEIDAEIQKMQEADTPKVRGDKLRDKFDTLYADAKTLGGRLFDRSGIGDFQLFVDDFASSVNGVVKSRYPTGAKVPDSIKNLLRATKKKTDPMLAPLNKAKQAGPREPATLSFKELRGHVKDMRDEWAQAKAAGDNRAAAILNDTIRKIEGNDGLFDQVKSSTDKQKVKNYNLAKRFWRTRVVDRFESNLGELMYRVDGKGNLKIAPENVIDRLIKKDSQLNSARYLEQFEKVFGDYKHNPKAWRQLEDTIVMRYKDRVYNKQTGKINEGLSAKFLDEHKNVFDKFPHLRDELTNIDTALTKLSKTRKEQISRQSARETTQLAVALKTGDLQGVVAQALKSEQEAARIMKYLAGDKKLTMAMQKQVAITLHKQSKTGRYIAGEEFQIVDGAKLSKELTDNASTYKILLGPRLYKSLTDLSKVHQAVDRTKIPSTIAKPKASGGPIEALTGQSFPSLLAQYRNVQYGRDNMVNFTARSVAAAGLKLRYKSLVEIELAALHNIKVADVLNRAKTTSLSPNELMKMAEVLEQQVGVQITRTAELMNLVGKTPEEQTMTDQERIRQDIIDRSGLLNRNAGVL